MIPGRRARARRLGLLAAGAAALALVSCFDDKVVIVENTSTTISGPNAPASYSIPAVPYGPSGVHEVLMAADLGSDGEPRMVYRSGGPTNTDQGRLFLVRRRPDGTWTTPAVVTAELLDYKREVRVFVSRSNDAVHVFWIQDPTAVSDPRLHYAQFDANDPPAPTVADTVISTGPVANLSLGASFGDVWEYVAEIDRATDDLAVFWTQDVSDGASGRLPIVGLVSGGTGALGERVALRDFSGTTAQSSMPALRASAVDGFHAMWYANAVYHRLRTGPGAWTSGPLGESVSPSGPQTRIAMDVAPDGDVYATWWVTSMTVVARRPAGPGSVFGASQPLPFIGAGTVASTRLVTLVEPGTEHVHVIIGRVTGPAAAPSASVHAAPDLSGTWTSVSLSPAAPAGTEAAGTFHAFVDTADTVTVVWRGPAVNQEPARILARSRPSGAASSYGALVDLTAAYAFPTADLALAADAGGNAIAVWRQGNVDETIPAEVFAAQYVPGSGFEASVNVSRTPSLPSRGFFVPLMGSGAAAHVFWNEGAGGFSPPYVDDVYYSTRRP